MSTETNAELPPALPDTSTWVRRAPGDVIEAGTPYVVTFSDRLTVAEPRNLPFTVSAEVAKVCTYWTPTPAPSEPWLAISTDRDKPTLAKVTWADGVRGGKTSTGMYYRNDRGIYDEWHDGIGRLDSIESVEVLHTHDPVTHVPVERALIEEAARLVAWWSDDSFDSTPPSGDRTAGEIVAALAALASDESSDTDGGRS